MLDISFWELVVIAVVMLFVIGPERLPAVIRVLSKRLAGLMKIYTQFKKDVLDDIQNHK